MTQYISTGHLPPAERVRQLTAQAHQLFSGDRTGEVAQIYPALARVRPDLFGIAVVSVEGETYAAGDAGVEFTIMSVTKPFVFALLCDEVGVDEAHDLIGVNATGLPFNSLGAVELMPGGRTNPMVNPGAIATTSHLSGFSFIHDGLSRFAGRSLIVDPEVCGSATATNHRNRAIAALLHGLDLLGCPPDDALDWYTRQCSLRVTATDLAVMGATLADGGVNPLTGEQVVHAESCHAALAVMTTAGLYETSGDWIYAIGLPGKSGIGGGIVTVSPGKGGLGTFAPRLDPAGNSIKGTLAARYLSRELGLDLFASRPAPR